MAELPLLFFPKPSLDRRSRRGGGGSRVSKPSAAEQQARHDRKFQRIADSFQDLRPSVEGAEPEQVIVLETVGSVDGLAKAAAQIPGLEWLTELELDKADPGDGFFDQDKPDKRLARRLYAVMSNQQAMSDLLGLWDSWCSDPTKEAQRNFGPFKTVFIHLKDVRRWGVRDRIEETRVVEYWEQALRYERGNVRFEVELWCRGNDARRRLSYQNLKKIIDSAGGQCVAQSLIPEILYYGVLAELPAPKIRRTVDKIMERTYSRLLRCEDVMFFRPHGQSVFPGHAAAELEKGAGSPAVRAESALPKGRPVVALLDGLPLEHHTALEGRLVIDDQDGHAELYKPHQQQHGTAMASLIVHGDLVDDATPLSRPVYVRPIFIPDEDLDKNVYEKTPQDRLLVDLVHRAVVRIKGTKTVAGMAPEVKVINLSLGNNWQPFFRHLSPLARLIDYLAWKYKLLFVVSVGNQLQHIAPAFETAGTEGIPDEEVCAKTLQAIHADQVSRRPFSPAEAMNAVTVGGLHADGSSWDGKDQRIDLLKGMRLPSPIGTVASGFNRSIKPDVLFPAGRQLYQKNFGVEAPPTFSVARSINAPGLRVAAPGTRPMELGRTIHSRGTSNATALATRTAAHIFDMLQRMKSEPGGDIITDDHVAVILKALLVHGASWGNAAAFLENVFGAAITDWRAMQRLKGRFLGYGEADTNRSLFASDKRVLMLGCNSLGRDQAHEYRVPLPPSLSGKSVKRRLTVTLAWLSSINCKHKDYRQGMLWFTADKERLDLHKTDLDYDSCRRGTVQHQVFESESVRAFSDGDAITVKVNCDDGAGRLTEVVPYALAVTLEVAGPVDLKIYQEMKARIRLRAPIGIEPKP